MEEEKNKMCTNCKRDIPVDNFMTHSMHCARNITVCHVCKEPVLHSELSEHQKKMHEPLPCLKCKENVCGTDMEDHIRDSCAFTVCTCRFCELELPRADLPTHETYCGTRTEQCPDCSEYVMIKYKQIHLDSNHGFIKLDDETNPVPNKDQRATNGARNINYWYKNGTPAFGRPITNVQAATSSAVRNYPITEIKYITNRLNNTRLNTHQVGTSAPAPMQTGDGLPATSSSALQGSVSPVEASSQACGSGAIRRTAKRTNDKYQVNTSTGDVDKLGQPSTSRGSNKKRPAPQPPRDLSLNILNDVGYWKGFSLQQVKEQTRPEQAESDLSLRLCPILNATDKLDKLRQMDALNSIETDYKNTLQDKIWNTPAYMTMTSPDAASSSNNLLNINPMSAEQFARRVKEMQMKNDSNQRKGSGNNGRSNERDLKPFVNNADRNLQRNNADRNLQSHNGGRDLRRNGSGDMIDRNKNNSDNRREGNVGAEKHDRFKDIKNELRELRRGLNEVTAPYNANSMSPPANINLQPATAPMMVSLPCEFCDELVPAQDLVDHQIGCQPGLAQLCPGPSEPNPKPLLPPSQKPQKLDGEPQSSSPQAVPASLVSLPCEFCEKLVPAQELVQHQIGCRPDLVQLRLQPGRPISPLPPPPEYIDSNMDQVPDNLASLYRLPLIPCEFCAVTLPIQLISEHQNICQMENPILFPD